MNKQENTSDIKKDSNVSENTFLYKKRRSEKKSRSIYMNNLYHDIARVAVEKYKFKNVSEFMNEVLASIIDDKECPGLKALYDHIHPKRDKKANTHKKLQEFSEYSFLEKYISTNGEKIERGTVTYSIDNRYYEILENYAAEYYVGISHILENMFEDMIQSYDTKKIE